MERQVPLMKENCPPHTHNVHMMEKLAGDGHVHDHNMYGKHSAGFQKEHDKVKAMCGGGMTKRK